MPVAHSHLFFPARSGVDAAGAVEAAAVVDNCPVIDDGIIDVSVVYYPCVDIRVRSIVMIYISAPHTAVKS